MATTKQFRPNGVQNRRCRAVKFLTNKPTPRPKAMRPKPIIFGKRRGMSPGSALGDLCAPAKRSTKKKITLAPVKRSDECES